ncbi:MAG: hypothetical protein ACRD9R_22435 [Pyrinomonadaceae bacterium]
MQADIREIYQQTIRSLSEQEKLQLAALILNDISRAPGGDEAQATPTRQGDITKFFGTAQGGDPQGPDNEKIDADLARAYAGNHENEN